MGTYTAKTRTVGRRPRSKRLRELGGTVTISNGGQPDLSPYELLSNKVTEVDQNSTDEQYPTAKLLYDLYAALGALIDALDEGKQDAIADLAAIRSGAALGATALQAITAAAGSDIGTVGTPSVTVSTQGSSTTLTFHQLKGAKGDKGDKGDTGATGPQGPAGSGGINYITALPYGTSTQPGWRRICKVSNSTLRYQNFFIMVSGSWYYRAPTNALIHCSVVESTAQLTQIGCCNPNIIQQVRLVYIQGNTYWLDVYISNYSSTEGEQKLGIFGDVSISDVQNTANPYTGNDTPSALIQLSNASGISLTSSNFSSYALPLTGGTISDQAITSAKSVVAINAKCTAAAGASVVAYGLKVALDHTSHGLGTNAAAIYASATAGYAGYFSGGVKVSATLTANSVSAATVYQTSDDRLKDYLGDFHFNLADLDRIPLRFFAFKADKERRVLLGTSAQAVQKVLPEIVGSSRTASEEDTEEYLNVDYSKLALVALDCVRQLRDEVATMKTEMAAMRAEIDKLKSGR